MKKIRKLRILYKNDGAALVTALLMLVIMTVIGIAAMTTSNLEILISGAAKNKQAAFYASEAGIEQAKVEINRYMRGDNVDPNGNQDLSESNFFENPIWDSRLLTDTSIIARATTATTDGDPDNLPDPDVENTALLFQNQQITDPDGNVRFTYRVHLWDNHDDNNYASDSDGMIYIQSDAQGPGGRASIRLLYAAVPGPVRQLSEEEKGDPTKGGMGGDKNFRSTDAQAIGQGPGDAGGKVNIEQSSSIAPN